MTDSLHGRGDMTTAAPEVDAGPNDVSEDKQEQHEATVPTTQTHANDDPDGKGKQGQENVLSYLESLRADVAARFAVQPIAAPPPSIRSDVHPFPHQLRGAALGLHAATTRFKGMILADPPWLGKTLQMCLIAEMAREPGDGPTLIVTVPSCTFQVLEQIESYRVEGLQDVVLLDDTNISTFDLFRHKYIITSYAYVVAEYRQIAKFEKLLQEYNDGKNIVPPTRPMLPLLSGIWEMDGDKLFGRWLMLDDAHTFSDLQTDLHAALTMLRRGFDSCLMMTATPLEDTWTDILGMISLLPGHPFTSILRMQEAFTAADEPGENKERHVYVPEGKYLARFVHFLHALMTARPAEIVSRNLPPIHTVTVEFELPENELHASNAAFADYQGGQDGE